MKDVLRRIAERGLKRAQALYSPDFIDLLLQLEKVDNAGTKTSIS